MSKVITVTLNPTLDRTLFVHHLAEGYPNTVTDKTRLDPAGRGVNISRALNKLNVPTTASLLLGNDAIGKAYRALIRSEDIQTDIIERDRLTRSNTIIYDSGTKQETHIIEEGNGFTDEDDEMRDIVERIVALVEPEDTVVLSGIVPRGVSVKIYAKLVEEVKAAGGSVVLAADGISLEIGMRATPNIIAMRQNELESFFNYPVRTIDDVVFSARKLYERSAGSIILIGENDMHYGILLDDERGWIAQLPQEEGDTSGTTSGAQDAFLAGFLAQYANAGAATEDIGQALKFAMAAAAFTTHRTGHHFGTPEDVQTFLDQIQLKPLEEETVE